MIDLLVSKGFSETVADCFLEEWQYANTQWAEGFVKRNDRLTILQSCFSFAKSSQGFTYWDDIRQAWKKEGKPMPIEINKQRAWHGASLQSKEMTDKEKLAALLKEKGMPGPLVYLMVKRVTVPYRLDVWKDYSLHRLVAHLFVWADTREGPFFWANVAYNMEWLESHRADDGSMSDSANAGSINNASLK